MAAQAKGLAKPVKLMNYQELKSQKNFGSTLSQISFKLKVKMVSQKMQESILLPIQSFYQFLKIQSLLVKPGN